MRNVTRLADSAPIIMYFAVKCPERISQKANRRRNWRTMQTDFLGRDSGAFGFFNVTFLWISMTIGTADSMVSIIDHYEAYIWVSSEGTMDIQR